MSVRITYPYGSLRIPTIQIEGQRHVDPEDDQMSEPPAAPKTHSRGLWVTIVILLALLVAVVAGILSWASGASVPTAILDAAKAFGGAAALCLALWYFILGGRTQ
ncbi:hypothetical protein ACQPZX_45680 [Actinoplanes sp. CA-142083]|uniref:hypothetical protein n=1 Tax=Actinoplanes sp. CA-142083 TaxID=3239903 RepID=UPI003D8ECB08